MSIFYALAAFLVWGVTVFLTGTSTMHDFTQNFFLAFLVGMVGMCIEDAVSRSNGNADSAGRTEQQQRKAERLAKERRATDKFNRDYGPDSGY